MMVVPALTTFDLVMQNPQSEITISNIVEVSTPCDSGPICMNSEKDRGDD
jgi:hypothetical protein